MSPSVAPPGDRYWVNGTGNWSDDAGHWALTSGGQPNAGNFPTIDDDVIINSASGFIGGGTITMDVLYSAVHDFTSETGHTYTLSGRNKFIGFLGSVSFEAGLTIDFTGIYGWVSFDSTSVGETITINGATFSAQVYVDGVGGSWELQDEWVNALNIEFDNGTFDANDQNITAGSFTLWADTFYHPTVNMGSGIWETTGSGGWYVFEDNGQTVTLNSETSKIYFSREGSQTFTPAGKTYYDVQGKQDIYFTGGNGTFHDITLGNNYAGGTVEYTFDSGFTYTVTGGFFATGEANHLIVIDANNLVANEQFILSKASGIVSCDYITLYGSNATGGALWYAGAHSVDGAGYGGNDGWIFTNYSRGDEVALPADSLDLETLYSAANRADVDTNNEVYVNQSATGQYAIHEFKNFVVKKGGILEWNGQTDVAPSVSPVYLQIYNTDSGLWEEIDSDSLAEADTDFTLTATIGDLTNYKTAENVVTCRVYQRSV
jgi:hypothetical protein